MDKISNLLLLLEEEPEKKEDKHAHRNGMLKKGLGIAALGAGAYAAYHNRDKIGAAYQKYKPKATEFLKKAGTTFDKTVFPGGAEERNRVNPPSVDLNKDPYGGRTMRSNPSYHSSAPPRSGPVPDTTPISNLRGRRSTDFTPDTNPAHMGVNINIAHTEPTIAGNILDKNAGIPPNVSAPVASSTLPKIRKQVRQKKEMSDFVAPEKNVIDTKPLFKRGSNDWGPADES